MNSLNAVLQPSKQILGNYQMKLSQKLKRKKNITDNSKIKDLKEFIDLIEKNVSAFSGKNKAAEICNAIRAQTLKNLMNGRRGKSTEYGNER